jgi:phosphopantothenoylcysteine decarboxylase/phosphopantothenate--cysteine ligase
MQKNVLLVGFKAETNVTNAQLIKSAKKKLKESASDMIIANDIGTSRYKKNSENNQIIIVDSKRNIVSGWMKKEKIAKIIRKQIELKLK